MTAQALGVNTTSGDRNFADAVVPGLLTAAGIGRIRYPGGSGPDGDALLVEGVGGVRRVQLVVGGACLGAEHVLDGCQFEQFAGFGGVDRIGGGDRASVSVAQGFEGYRAHGVVFALGGHRAVFGQNRETAGGRVRREHRFQYRERDLRLDAQLADTPRAGVEVAERESLGP